jgi:Holliday junction resolvase RusA-like endonuclease
VKYKLFLKLPGLPKLNNSHHVNWRVAAAERKKWRRAAYLHSLPKRPLSPLPQCIIICTRYSHGKQPDFDNLVISFKSIIDGLKDAGIIVDDNSDCILERQYRSNKAPPKKGYVEIEVEEI